MIRAMRTTVLIISLMVTQIMGAGFHTADCTVTEIPLITAFKATGCSVISTKIDIWLSIGEHFLGLEELKEKFEKAIEKIDNAESFEEVKKVYKDINDVRMTFSTMGSLAYIRHSVNTLDEFYDKEREFFDEKGPVYGEYEYNLALALVRNKFNKYTSIIFKVCL